MTMVQNLCYHFGVNYNDLTQPHPKWWFMWGIAPQPPYFRLVKYHNSPRPFLGKCTTYFRTYFSGDWDVHWGTIWILTHGHMGIPLGLALKGFPSHRLTRNLAFPLPPLPTKPPPPPRKPAASARHFRASREALPCGAGEAQRRRPRGGRPLGP